MLGVARSVGLCRVGAYLVPHPIMVHPGSHGPLGAMVTGMTWIVADSPGDEVANRAHRSGFASCSGAPQNASRREATSRVGSTGPDKQGSSLPPGLTICGTRESESQFQPSIRGCDGMASSRFEDHTIGKSFDVPSVIGDVDGHFAPCQVCLLYTSDAADE